MLPFPDPAYIFNKHIFHILWNKQDRIERDTVLGKQ